MTVESGGTSPALLLGALIGLVALAVVVFMLVLGYLRGQGDQEGGERRKERRRAQWQGAGTGGAKEGEAEEALAPAPSDFVRPGEVMRVLRDPETGRVVIEVGRRRYEHIREIEDAQVGRRVLWAIADLVRFTGGMATNAQAVRSASQGVTWEQERRAPPQAGAARSAASPAPADAGIDVLPAKLGQTMSEFFRRGLGPIPSDSTRSGPGTFIEQIEAILQEQLAALDAPLPQEVHVSAGPEQRLKIQVGRAVYGSVDDVPDPQVRTLIRAAVAEWERRS